MMTMACATFFSAHLPSPPRLCCTTCWRFDWSLNSFRMSQSELACVYAALILHDDNVDISADNISTLIKAANVKVEPYLPSLFAKLFETRSVADLITNVGAGGGGGGVAAPAAGGGGGGGGGAAAADKPKEEEKKEEEEEEEDEDMGFSLFD